MLVKQSAVAVSCRAFLLKPPESVGLLLPDLSHGSLNLFFFVSQCVSEHLSGQLQLRNPHLLCHTGPAGRERGESPLLFILRNLH